MIERSLFYWSGMYYSQMTQGMKYTELRPTICINIVDFILFPEEQEFHSINTVMNKKSKRIITENMQLHFLEIPKSDSRMARKTNGSVGRFFSALVTIISCA